MGVSFYDKEAQHRRLEAMFDLTTSVGVEEFLTHWEKIKTMQLDCGDYGAVDVMVDMERAIDLAGLTLKQAQVIYYVCLKGYTQKEVADLLGITQPAISQMLECATAKIADVFKRWAKLGEGYKEREA